VRWLAACEDVRPETEERALLEDVTNTTVETVTENTSLIVTVICKLWSRVSNKFDYQSKPRL
jgi:hypothetical protein